MSYSIPLIKHLRLMSIVYVDYLTFDIEMVIMVQCDCCKHWYHCKYVFVLDMSFWKCTQCLES